MIVLRTSPKQIFVGQTDYPLQREVVRYGLNITMIYLCDDAWHEGALGCEWQGTEQCYLLGMLTAHLPKVDAFA